MVSVPPLHLSVVAISKRYGGQAILKDVSLAVAKGEFIALVGPSGCGKSTLLKIIAGLEAADAGTIHLGGRDVGDRRAADRDVAMVFQSYALYPHLTARQNMSVPLAMRRFSAWQRLPVIGAWIPGYRTIAAAIGARVAEVAESLRITALLDRKPGAMSGGQRQRVALGRAIVREPQAFLMDEPLSNLDAALRVHTRAEIVDLHRRMGATTIYVTHDQEEALSMADRIAVMKEGRILQVGTPRAIYADPDHLDVAEFIGTPKINLIAADVNAAGAIHIGGAALLDGFAAWRGQVLTLGLRPDHAELVATQHAPRDEAGARLCLPFTLERVEFLGADAIAHGFLASGSHIRVRVGTAFAETARTAALTLVVSAAHLLVFAADGTRIRVPLAQATQIDREAAADA